jgi:general stress protein YciG
MTAGREGVCRFVATRAAHPTKEDIMSNYNPSQNLSSEARSKGGQNSPGNFKNDPGRAARAGSLSHGGHGKRDE